MTDSELLFRKLRDVALTRPARSMRFITYVKGNRPVEFHHVFGSAGSLKSTDYLGVAVNTEEHTCGQNDKEWVMRQLPQALRNLLDYVVYLEDMIHNHYKGASQ